MGAAEALQDVHQKLLEAQHRLQTALEQQLNVPKERRCSSCNKLLCKSTGYTEIKCSKCGTLNEYH